MAQEIHWWQEQWFLIILTASVSTFFAVVGWLGRIFYDWWKNKSVPYKNDLEVYDAIKEVLNNIGPINGKKMTVLEFINTEYSFYENTDNYFSNEITNVLSSARMKLEASNMHFINVKMNNKKQNLIYSIFALEYYIMLGKFCDLNRSIIQIALSSILQSNDAIKEWVETKNIIEKCYNEFIKTGIEELYKEKTTINNL